MGCNNFETSSRSINNLLHITKYQGKGIFTNKTSHGNTKTFIENDKTFVQLYSVWTLLVTAALLVFQYYLLFNCISNFSGYLMPNSSFQVSSGAI